MLSKLIVACEQGSSYSYMVIGYLDVPAFTLSWFLILFSDKSSSQSMLPYCQLDHNEHNSMRIC